MSTRRARGMWSANAVGAAFAAALLAAGVPAWAQAAPSQPMGTVSTRDARVGGGLEVGGETVRLVNNASVTANDRTAPVALTRGGHVLVCSTSEFHLLRAGSGEALLFGLNRGALEILSTSETGDVVLTPDLKLTPVTKGSYDLRLRVTREGDTCVENAGSQAPVLSVTDAFTSANYRVLPGQHILFVGGDLHKVVDGERSPCGCPAAVPPPVAVAGAVAAHPFPQAESEGLAAPAPPGNEAPVGAASSQVSTTFSYNEGQGTPPGGSAGASGSTGTATATPPDAAKPGGFGAAIRRFFHKLFHPGS